MKLVLFSFLLFIVIFIIAETFAASKNETKKKFRKPTAKYDKRRLSKIHSTKKLKTRRSNYKYSNQKVGLKNKKNQKPKRAKSKKSHRSKVKSYKAKKKSIRQKRVTKNVRKRFNKSKNKKRVNRKNKKTQPKKRPKKSTLVMGKTIKAVPKNRKVSFKNVEKKNIEESVMALTQWPEGSYSSKQDSNNYAVFGPKNDRAIQMAFSSTKGKPVSGVFDVITHGFTDGTLMNSQKGKSTAKELAKWILENTNYKPGTPIRLLVCNSGSKNTNDPNQLAMAQKVANALGATVYGANTYVSATDFTPVVMDDQVRDKEYRWGSFEPGKRAKEVPQVKARKLSDQQIADYSDLGNDLDAYQKTTEVEKHNANMGSPNTVEKSMGTYKAYKNKYDNENQYY